MVYQAQVRYERRPRLDTVMECMKFPNVSLSKGIATMSSFSLFGLGGYSVYHIFQKLSSIVDITAI